MCGIVGYVGHRSVQEILLSGLERLEYRGYDSAGISLQADGRLDAVRAVGNLARLRAAVAAADAAGEAAVAGLAPPAPPGGRPPPPGRPRPVARGNTPPPHHHPHPA